MSDADSAMEMMRTTELFGPGRTMAWDFLLGFTWGWEALEHIGGLIARLAVALDPDEYDALPCNAWIHKTASVAPSAYIGENIIIGEGAQIRHCAFIRSDALVGAGCVVGNSTELKNVILFDGVQVPHFNYVGDSILGYKSHMGAGAITSNCKSDHTAVSVRCGGERAETGLRKFGALIGDNVEIGCNSVLNPGCVIGPNSTIYPLSSVRGYVPARSIYKDNGEIVEKS